MQVNSSDVPETFNMTKCLAVAFSIASIGAGTSVLLFALADPTRLNWWSCELAACVHSLSRMPATWLRLVDGARTRSFDH